MNLQTASLKEGYQQKKYKFESAEKKRGRPESFDFVYHAIH